MRANSAVERWQWFDGFPTLIVGRTTTFSVTRGTRHLRVSVTTKPFNIGATWYLWVGPAGMLLAALMAALIAWRAEPTTRNLTLAAALVSLAAGALAAISIRTRYGTRPVIVAAWITSGSSRCNRIGPTRGSPI